MADKNKQNDGKNDLAERIKQHEAEGIALFGKSYGSANADYYSGVNDPEPANPKPGSKRTDNQTQKEPPEGGKPKTVFTVEDALNDWDPGETRVQPGELYRFRSPHLARNGHF